MAIEVKYSYNLSFDHSCIDNYCDAFCLKTLDLHFSYSILVLKLK
jgi:hypothetical protein